ncbi:MAG: hypothetical protein WBD31_06750, partial [Rubripirellula sp.]
ISDTNSGDSLVGVTGQGAGGLSDPGESLTFSYASGSVALGDPGTGAAVNFIGFRNLRLSNFGDDDDQNSGTGETAIISGALSGNGTFNDGDQSSFDSLNALGNSLTFTVGAGNTGDNFFVQRVGARIEFQGATAVPEISSLAMFGVGAIPLSFWRKRRAKLVKKTPHCKARHA